MALGRIMKAAAAPVGAPWPWTILSYENRQPMHGYKVTREARWGRSPKAGGGEVVVEADDRGESNQHPGLLEREDCKLLTWYPSLYAPRTGGAYDSHHQTAGIAGCARRRGHCMAARGARPAAGCGAGRHAPRHSTR